MKKPSTALMGCLLSLLSFTSCSLDYEYTEEDRRNDYLREWIIRNGLIDPNQDWNMARQVSALIDCESFGPGYTVKVYDKDPLNGGVLIADVAQTATYNIDVRKDAKSVFVKAYAPNSTRYYAATYTIEDSRTDIIADEPCTEASMQEDRAPLSRAAGDADRYNWLLACEDLGSTGDVDFNDIVIGLTYTAGSTDLKITAMAAGGIYEAWVCYNGARQFEIHQALGKPEAATGNYPMVNTTGWNADIITEHHVTVNNDFSVAKLMGGLSIEVVRGTETRNGTLIEDKSVLTAPETGDAPQIICVPGGWEWPWEREDIRDVYPDFSNWSRTATVTDWDSHRSPTAKYVHRGGTTPTPPVQPTGIQEYEITVNGTTRTYQVYIPEKYYQTQNPALVLSLHGACNYANQHMPFDTSVADNEGCLVVYGQSGIMTITYFGGDVTCWNAEGSDNADVAYIRAVLADVASKHPYNNKKVYCCGFSNGGMETYALANVAPELFAAFAACAGFPVNEFHLWTEGSANPSPKPFMHIHGTDDPTVKYINFPVIRDMMVTRNGANPVPTVNYGSNYTKYLYDALTVDNSKGAPYLVYIINGMQHSYVSNNIEYGSISQAMWEFFERYSLDDSYDTTLKWRLNIDTDNFYPTQDIGNLKRWAIEVNNNRTQYRFGYKNPGSCEATGYTDNVYPALQIPQNSNYVLKFKTTGDASRYVYVEVRNLNDNNVKDAVYKARVGDEVTIPYGFYSRSEYMITISKENASDKFTKFEFHSGSGNLTNASATWRLPGTYTSVTQTPFVAESTFGATNRTEVRDGDNLQYIQYDYNTTTGGMQGAFKTTDITLPANSDYIEIEFAEPTPSGWQLGFVEGNEAIDLPAGVNSFRKPITGNMVKYGSMLYQVCLLRLWDSSPSTIKVKSITIHSY